MVRGVGRWLAALGAGTPSPNSEPPPLAFLPPMWAVVPHDCMPPRMMGRRMVVREHAAHFTLDGPVALEI